MGLDQYINKNGKEALYFRKHNQIHSFFVRKAQGGNDDCEEYPVNISLIRELLGLVNSAIKTQDASILPPMGGFFFGSTDVDEYYWQDLEETQKKLRGLLRNHRTGDSYTYRASW